MLEGEELPGGAPHPEDRAGDDRAEGTAADGAELLRRVEVHGRVGHKGIIADGEVEVAAASASRDGGDELMLPETVEPADATKGHGQHADRGGPADGAPLLLEDRRAPLDGEVIPPETAKPARPIGVLFAEVNAAHDELVAGMRTTVEKAAAVGRALIKAKQTFPFGNWLPTLEMYTPIKRRMAARYMALARAKEELVRRDWSRMTKMGVTGALADLSGRGRGAREQAKERDPDPAAQSAAPPATTEEKAVPESERQPEPIPGRDFESVARPAVEASTAVAPIEPTQTPKRRNKTSGQDLLSEITALQKKRDEGALERSRGLASLGRRSALARELLVAMVAAERGYLQGLEDLLESLDPEMPEAAA
jgi:hypothetical protein